MNAKRLLTLCAAIMFFISVLAPSSPAGENTSNVSLSNISGNVEVMLSGSTVWKKAAGGMTLSSGDSIRTAKNSSVMVVFNAERTNVSVIKPGSHVVVILKKNEKFELVDGSILSSLKDLPPGSEFEIRTPLAVCGVRGTVYDVSYEAKRSLTIVSVFENSVLLKSIKDAGKAAPIGQGQKRELCPWNKTLIRAKGTGIPGAPKAPKDRTDIKETEYIKAFGPAEALKTERAAEIDAYRNMAAEVYGIVIDSKSTLQDYADANTVVKAKVHGIIRGAEKVLTEYYTDGSIEVTLKMEGKNIKDSLSPLIGDIFGSACLSAASTASISDFEGSLL